jgi:Na+/proline symporter
MTTTSYPPPTELDEWAAAGRRRPPPRLTSLQRILAHIALWGGGWILVGGAGHLLATGFTMTPFAGTIFLVGTTLTGVGLLALVVQAMTSKPIRWQPAAEDMLDLDDERASA